MSKSKSHLKSIIIASLSALLLSQGSFFGTPSPLVIGLCILAPIYTVPAVLLTYALYFILLSFDGYTACMLLAAIVISVIRRKLKLSNGKLTAIATAILSLSLIVAGIFFSVPVSNWITTSVILFGFTYLSGGDRQLLSTRIAVYAIVIVSLASIPLPFINLGRSLAVFTLLHVARLNDPYKSALISTVAAGALIMANPHHALSAVFICAGCMLVSVISSRSRLRQPLYIACLSLIYSVLTLDDVGDFFFAVDCFAASALFVFTYDSVGDYIFRCIANTFKNTLVNVCDGYACQYALSKISEEISSVNISAPARPRNSTVAYSRVCANCRKHSICFTDKAVDLSLLDFPEYDESVLDNCIRKQDIQKAISEADNRYGYLTEKQMNCKREIAKASSFINLANNLVSSLTVKNTVDIILSNELKNRLSDSIPKQAECWIYTDNSALVKLDESAYINQDRLLKTLTAITSIKYQKPSAVKYNGFTYISVYPQAKYVCDFSSSGISAKANQPSGDVFVSCTHANVAYYILSDGMGTGEQAHRCAKSLTDSLLILLESGIQPELAIELASISVMFKDIDESFATLDILAVDLTSGKCIMYKCGGGDSYVMGDEVIKIKGGGYPVGVFEKCFISKEEFDLPNGGEVIMASDGAELSIKKIQLAVVNSEQSGDLCELLLPQNNDNFSENDDALVSVVALSCVGE